MLKTIGVLAVSVCVFFAGSGCSGVEARSARSQSELVGSDGGGGDCTFTQGFWKNHSDAWPVSSLTLGTVTYTQAQLLDIFDMPVKGNGLISLAHQLIAAKLNVANGATSPTIAATIAAADALIGSLVVGTGYLAPAVASPLVGSLDAFNNLEGDNCGAPPTPTCPPVCGNGRVEEGEECDDGNTTGGDGCSAECRNECPPAPVCGNGIVEPGEDCDDGNLVCGDGCSPTCTFEPR